MSSFPSGLMPTFRERRPFIARYGPKDVKVSVRTLECKSAFELIPSFCLELRVEDVQKILQEHKNKIPVIIERFHSENYLPLISHCKFLVPDHITIADLVQIIRRRLHLHPEQALFLLVNEKSMFSNTMTVAEVYAAEKSDDGFLYVVYTSQPAFGDFRSCHIGAWR